MLNKLMNSLYKTHFEKRRISGWELRFTGCVSSKGKMRSSLRLKVPYFMRFISAEAAKHSNKELDVMVLFAHWHWHWWPIYDNDDFWIRLSVNTRNEYTEIFSSYEIVKCVQNNQNIPSSVSVMFNNEGKSNLIQYLTFVQCIKIC